MAILKLQGESLSAPRYRRAALNGDIAWTRPSDWLSLPAVNSGDQKFVGLYAVYPSDANFVALAAGAGGGATSYLVDWGDGSAQQVFNSNAQADHNYNYSSLNSNTLTSRGYRQAVISVIPVSSTITRYADGDDFSSPRLVYIAADGGTYTSGAIDGNYLSREANEPIPYGQSSHTCWWTYTPTSSGSCTVDTQLTTGDTVLAVYTGTAINALSLVGKDDDSGGSSTSRLTFSATSGTTYRIQAGGYQSGALPNLQLRVTGPAAGSSPPAYNPGESSYAPTGTLTSVDLQKKHSQSGLISGMTTGWLDIRMAGASVTSLTVGGSTVNQGMLEQFEYVGGGSLTSANNLFSSCYVLASVLGTTWTSSATTFQNTFNKCYSLRSIPLLNTGSGTDFFQMFNDCVALRTIPLLNTASSTTLVSMFSGCSFLRSVPPLNTGSCTNFSQMFNACSSLRTIPLINTGAGTNFSNMFTSCSSLEEVPLLNTGAGTNFSNMFNACTSLRAMPLLNTAAGTNFNGTFSNCRSLQAAPLLGTGSGTNFSSMFYSCYALKTIPLLNTAAGTNFSNMFNSCFALKTIPLLNTAAGTDFSFMFNGCTALQAVPLLNTAAGTNFNAMFTSCPSLAVGALSGTSKTISYSGCCLSATELNAIYTNLASGVTTQTITVSSNYGTTGDDPTIATAKGWTVTGS